MLMESNLYLFTDCDSSDEFDIAPSSQGSDSCGRAVTETPKEIRDLSLAAQEARPVGCTLNDCQVFTFLLINIIFVCLLA